MLQYICWGFWGSSCSYAGKTHFVFGLIADPHPGLNWYPEPHTVADVVCSNDIVHVEGTFRHRQCAS
jgi:hypothetical protein